MGDTEQEPTFADKLPELLDRYHQLAASTQNPIYAWLAFQAIFWARDLQGSGIDQEASFPAWLVDYIQEITENLLSLSAGLDPRVQPLVGTYVPSSPDDAMNSQEFQDDLRRRRISLPEAVKLVPLVLGLTREGGWNAFSAVDATTQKMQEFRIYESMRENGFTSQQAIQKLHELYGPRSDRARYLRVAEGREHADGQLKKPEG
ncbi:hypothetical protein [Acidisoma cladoniae]|jgi:hypothetical protein|uniref:hypothetical protein n=1 Tax=Acidisoma cladoniae TaxID=3040935 RepID=UPI00254D46A6|nr:hypothetical protein [Acidisoma sp. PAMC 29798]